MYSKNDFLKHFYDVNVDSLSYDQIVSLFHICIRHDSYKIGLLIYLKHIKQHDITSDLIKRVISSMKNSNQFHEIKLFFIHHHLEVLSVEDLNTLVDVILELLLSRDYKLNPILSQYNTIKVALLIFKISWRIEQMNIYSLITKCQLINKYIQKSLG